MRSRKRWSICRLTLVAAGFVLGCQQTPSTSHPAPPLQVNRLAELRQMPRGEHARPNPTPAPWMSGCYAVAIANVTRDEWTPPGAIRLTPDPAGRDLIQQRYRVTDQATGVSPESWSWLPLSSDELRVTIGTTMSVWELRLRRTPRGLQGEGKFRTDSLQPDRHRHAVELVRSRCE